MINLNDNSVLCKVMVMLLNATFNNALIISDTHMKNIGASEES
jgi:hypothetical protein